MSSNNGLSSPGSSTYSSDTLHVGDGTWDSTRDTFLLPNLMGLNFDTMQYNGMGNRFRDMPEYHSLILAHGVIGTMVFLGFVPFSILILRYYSFRDSYLAFKLHVWAQVLTLLLSTVVFLLGWFAVGPKRSLTNPHHGIGLAIYVMVIFQVLWGWHVHRTERRRKRRDVPLKVVIHRWVGRALAVLGVIQIPLGLTLYGSPKALFIIFAIAGFGLLATFLVLSYAYDTRGYYYMEHDYDDQHSRVSGRSDHRGRHMAAAAAAATGLAAAFRHRPRSRHTSNSYEDSHLSDVEEKYSEEPAPRRSGWGKRFLEIGALTGGAVMVKKYFDRRHRRDSDTESGGYRPAHSRTASMTEESLSRVEGERREPSHPAAHSQPLSRSPSRSSSRSPSPSRPPGRARSPYSSYYTDSAYYHEHENAQQSHPFRDALAGAGIFAAARKLFGSNKKKEEQRRVDEILRHDAEQERIARANSRRYTGDGTLPRRDRRAHTLSTTDISSDRSTPHGERPVASGAINPPISPVPPMHHSSAPSLAADDPHSQRAHSPSAEAHDAPPHRHEEHVESPPVSLKVKMHNDGRNITLRRLTEEEAAASREARRERRHSHRRRGSTSSLSGNEAGYDRWRRVEELERQQEEQIRREQAAAAAAAAAPTPPPPHIPPAGNIRTGSMPTSAPPSASMAYIPQQPPPPHAPIQSQTSLPYGSYTSPTYTGTEASGDYASNRRRRRAERARTRQDRQQHGVEFT